MANVTVQPNAEQLLSQILGLNAERSKIAQEEATAAQQQVAQAETAPAPQRNMLTDTLATSLGRVGDSLSSPGAGITKQVKGEIAGQKSVADKSRLDNITRLRATYEKAAERSLKIGDNESEVKARVALKKIDEQMAKEKQSAEEARRTAEFAAEGTQWMEREDVKKENALGLEGVRHSNDMQLEGMRQRGRKELKTDASGKYSKLDDEHVHIVGQQLVDGTLPWSKIGQADVGKVAKWVEESGQIVLSNEGRKNVGKLDGFEAAIDEIAHLSTKVNTAKGPNRFGTGTKNTVEGFLRNSPRGIAANQLEESRKQFLALIARGYGEVGNLAEQEQVRQLEGLPSGWTDVESAQASLAKAKRIIAKLRAMNIKARTEPMGGMAVGGKSTSTSGVAPAGGGGAVKWGRDAAGNPVRIQ